MLPLLALLLCGDCHQEIADRFARSSMGRTSGPVEPASEHPGTFLHPASNTRFDILRAGTALVLVWGKQSEKLAFYVGSGRMGRSYAFLENDYLYQAPVGYYATKRAWDMAPGYEHDTEPDLNRPITADCLFCHAGGARAISGTLNRIANLGALHGITCERCHGNGVEHARNPRGDNIVNPKSLTGAARDSVCEQCHLAGLVRLPLPGEQLRDFSPGRQLADFLQVFVPAGRSRGVRVNGHSEALAQSRCRQGSESRMWCGTCHDPHAQTSSYNEKCLSCHAAAQCPSASSRTGDCITCHMPKARAVDGGHTVFTDHSIPRRSTDREDSAPVRNIRSYFDPSFPGAVEARNLGLAYAGLARQQRSPELMAKAWPFLRESVSAGDRDPALLTQVASILQANGNQKQAIELYRRSLAMDANQMDALVNLATLLRGVGDAKEARTLLERAAVLCPRCVRLP